MNFTHLESTKLFDGRFRIDADGKIQQAITQIQHRKVGETSIGIKHYWEPILINGVEISVTDYPDKNVFYILKGGYRSLLFTGKYFIDEKSILLADVFIFIGYETIKSVAFVLNGPHRLCAYVEHKF